jgi:hypothetical protein
MARAPGGGGMEGVECRLLEYRPMAPRTAPHDRMVLGWRNPIGSHLAKRRGLWSSRNRIRTGKRYSPEGPARVTRQTARVTRGRRTIAALRRYSPPPCGVHVSV